MELCTSGQHYGHLGFNGEGRPLLNAEGAELLLEVSNVCLLLVVGDSLDLPLKNLLNRGVLGLSVVGQHVVGDAALSNAHALLQATELKHALLPALVGDLKNVGEGGLSEGARGGLGGHAGDVSWGEHSDAVPVGGGLLEVAGGGVLEVAALVASKVDDNRALPHHLELGLSHQHRGLGVGGNHAADEGVNGGEHQLEVLLGVLHSVNALEVLVKVAESVGVGVHDSNHCSGTGSKSSSADTAGVCTKDQHVSTGDAGDLTEEALVAANLHKLHGLLHGEVPGEFGECVVHGVADGSEVAEGGGVDQGVVRDHGGPALSHDLHELLLLLGGACGGGEAEDHLLGLDFAILLLLGGVDLEKNQTAAY